MTCGKLSVFRRRGIRLLKMIFGSDFVNFINVIILEGDHDDHEKGHGERTKGKK